MLIDETNVTVELSTAEKLESLHGDLTLPRSAVQTARAVPDGMAEVHGLRAPGTGLPGVLLAGTFHDHGTSTFAVCHRRSPAVVLELTGEPYDRLVITLDDPQAAVARLG
jgi:hypothetical protein